jgi:hypothetical protein
LCDLNHKMALSGKLCFKFLLSRSLRHLLQLTKRGC